MIETYPRPANFQEREGWRDWARCASGAGHLTALFYSLEIDKIEEARRICAECVVRAECLAEALARKEPAGVWGGELFSNGRIVGEKRPPGRPPNGKGK